MKKHLNGHEIRDDFKAVVSKGKVMARAKDKEETESKAVKVSGCRVF